VTMQRMPGPPSPSRCALGISAANMKAVVDAAGLAGGDVAEALRRAGIDPAALADQNNRVSWDEMQRLFHALSDVMGCEAFLDAVTARAGARASPAPCPLPQDAAPTFRSGSIRVHSVAPDRRVSRRATAPGSAVPRSPGASARPIDVPARTPASAQPSASRRALHARPPLPSRSTAVRTLASPHSARAPRPVGAATTAHQASSATRASAKLPLPPWTRVAAPLRVRSARAAHASPYPRCSAHFYSSRAHAVDVACDPRLQ
jgi:hypothetical protein